MAVHVLPRRQEAQAPGLPALQPQQAGVVRVAAGRRGGGQLQERHPGRRRRRGGQGRGVRPARRATAVHGPVPVLHARRLRGRQPVPRGAAALRVPARLGARYAARRRRGSQGHGFHRLRGAPAQRRGPRRPRRPSEALPRGAQRRGVRTPVAPRAEEGGGHQRAAGDVGVVPQGVPGRRRGDRLRAAGGHRLPRAPVLHGPAERTRSGAGTEAQGAERRVRGRRCHGRRHRRRAELQPARPPLHSILQGSVRGEQRERKKRQAAAGQVPEAAHVPRRPPRPPPQPGRHARLLPLPAARRHPLRHPHQHRHRFSLRDQLRTWRDVRRALPHLRPPRFGGGREAPEHPVRVHAPDAGGPHHADRCAAEARGGRDVQPQPAVRDDRAHQDGASDARPRAGRGDHVADAEAGRPRGLPRGHDVPGALPAAVQPAVRGARRRHGARGAGRPGDMAVRHDCEWAQVAGPRGVLRQPGALVPGGVPGPRAAGVDVRRGQDRRRGSQLGPEAARRSARVRVHRANSPRQVHDARRQRRRGRKVKGAAAAGCVFYAYMPGKFVMHVSYCNPPVGGMGLLCKVNLISSES